MEYSILADCLFSSFVKTNTVVIATIHVKARISKVPRIKWRLLQKAMIFRVSVKFCASHAVLATMEQRMICTVSAIVTTIIGANTKQATNARVSVFRLMSQDSNVHFLTKGFRDVSMRRKLPPDDRIPQNIDVMTAGAAYANRQRVLRLRLG